MPKCIILYHYYYPDDVVSARHFTDLAESLYSKGWDVEVFTSSHYCRKDGIITPYLETHNGVHIRRFKGAFSSKSEKRFRLLNSFYISIKWFVALLFKHPDVIVMGTDPQFSFFFIPFLKILRPSLRIAIWGFDLYPEAIIADGIKLPKFVNGLLRWWAGISYRKCSLLVDIGDCMRKRLLSYNSKAVFETILPWALDEPEKTLAQDNAVRNELFGNASIGILYSGTIGRAHQFDEFILLARELRKRGASISFCFAGHGNRYKNLRNMVTSEDTNITFADFIDEKLLPLRLASADIHMISLCNGWEGVVVPSKFFGSLAAGRPLLYCGTLYSSLVEIIRRERLGFVVENENIKEIADHLEKLSSNKADLLDMQEAAFTYYKKHFSREIQCTKWDKCLREYII